MAAPQQLNNYVGHSLASPATAGALVLTWDSVSGWPTTGEFMLRLDDAPPLTTFEYVKVTAVNVGASTTTVVRGQEGTTGIAHSVGTVGGNELTAGMLQAALGWNMNQYHAEVYLAAAQSIPLNTPTPLAFDTIVGGAAVGDPNGNFTLGAGAKYTCPVAGRYLVTGAYQFSMTQATTNLFATINKNGAEALRGMDVSTPTHAGSPGGSVSGILRCAAADTLQVCAYLTAAAAAGTQTGPGSCYAQFQYIGP